MSASPSPPAGPGREALQRLIEGNRRFVSGRSAQPVPGPAQVAGLVGAQRPIATILGCSDSRVSPEIVFDQSLGDLFIVRVAGNVVGTETSGSLGYALLHLRTPLFVVLGHEGCGAVQAALHTKFRQHVEPGKIGDLLAGILPALDGIDPDADPAAQWQSGVEANVRWAVRQLAASPIGRDALAEGRIQLVGAIYELATGRVRWLPDSA